MKNIYFFAVALACFGILSGISYMGLGDLQKLNSKSTHVAGYFLYNFSGLILEGALPPSPYQFGLIAEKQVPDTSADIEAAKFLFADKDSVILAHKAPSGNMSTLYLYTLSGNGNAIYMSSQENLEYTGRDTYINSVTDVPGQYRFLAAGQYDYSSTVSYPILAFFPYSSSSLPAPSYWGVSPVSDSFVFDTDSGDVTGDGIADYALLLEQENASKDFIRLTVRMTSSSSTAIVGSKYATGELPSVKIGKYIAAAAKDIIVAGWDGSQTDLLHYRRFANGSLTEIQHKDGLATSSGKNIHVLHLGSSDLDNDGKDELLVSGYYPADAYASLDVLQVYKYGTSWQKASEHVGATPGHSAAFFVGAADVNADGMKEIVSASYGAYTNSKGDFAAKARVNIFKYDPGSSALQRVSSHDIKAASDKNGYWPNSAALGDYNADGRQELAIHYLDMDSDNYKLGIYSIGQDVGLPEITIHSPYYSTYSNVGSLPIKFYAYDSGGLNTSSFRAKLTGPGGYDSGYKMHSLNNTFGTNGIVYNSSVSIAGLPSGNYTVNYEVKDMAGNKKTASKGIRIYSAAELYPKITAYSPSATSFYGNATISIKFQAYDADGINASSLRARIGNSTFATPDIPGTASGPQLATARNFTALYPLSGIPPGAYYIYMFAKDALGYLSVDYKYLVVYATPSTPAPGPELSANETPAFEPEIQVEQNEPEPVQPLQNETPAAPPVEPPAAPIPEPPVAPPSEPPAAPPAKPDSEPPAAPPSEPPAKGNDAAVQADKLIGVLEMKISIASAEGIAPGAAQAYLDGAKALRDGGSYTQSAVEAQKGIGALESSIANSGKKDTPEPAPPAPAPAADTGDLMLIAAGALAIVILALGAVFLAGMLGLGGFLGGIYLIFRKKPEGNEEKRKK